VTVRFGPGSKSPRSFPLQQLTAAHINLKLAEGAIALSVRLRSARDSNGVEGGKGGSVPPVFPRLKSRRWHR